MKKTKTALARPPTQRSGVFLSCSTVENRANKGPDHHFKNAAIQEILIDFEKKWKRGRSRRCSALEFNKPCQKPQQGRLSTAGDARGFLTFGGHGQTTLLPVQG